MEKLVKNIGKHLVKRCDGRFFRNTDPRAHELERRVFLSQYLLAIYSAGSTPDDGKWIVK
ncbi:hypothetical protein JCM9157_4677 [Halalkalibacter akibai JCM 9157]|uniref:Uncharacterized protein n=1 Tax=Halalkalibacter akibai (strain ATCC 43226 / DSM 21942 / CIP 109018 / JCM 9157 / 1139) TaxID=1236973 RepID=W4QZ29_HALA3|nr:hypothetical protein JCM9157_4677 [Halalkalibacter akibai JCM 9157]